MSRKQAKEFDEPDLADVDEPADAAASGPMNELIRRMAALGLSSFFTTESAIRRAFGDTVPKDWVDFANEQSERTRREVVDRMAQALSEQMAEMDMGGVLSKFLTGHTVEINARVTLKPREDGDTASGLRTRVEFDSE